MGAITLKSPVQKAVWFIETHFTRPISLAEVADASGVTRFHLARAFNLQTGSSVLGYARKRRLSEAAKAIRSGAGDILSLAIDYGYSSHEAFSRAFRVEFGIAPSTLRQSGVLETLKLTEPFDMTMNKAPAAASLREPRFVDAKTIRVAGLVRPLRDPSRIPQQWQDFTPWIGNIPGGKTDATYGVCAMASGEDDLVYLTGVEIDGDPDLPAPLEAMTLAEGRYAVFEHVGHVSTIGATWHAILENWLPESGFEHLSRPDFEKYDERFNPAMGDGICEIWIPVSDV